MGDGIGDREANGTAGVGSDEATAPASVAWCRYGGSALVGLGVVGALTWLWSVVRSQFGDESPIFHVDGRSWEFRIDAFATHLPLVIESAVVIGVGLALRLVADYTASRAGWTRPASKASGSALTLLVGSAAVLAVVVLAATAGDDDEGDAVASTADVFESTDDGPDETGDRDDIEDPTDGFADEGPERDPPPLPDWSLDGPPDAAAPDAFDPGDTPEVESLPMETLTVHTDGCGVIRTDNAGGARDLTWRVTDLDGFQVLGRNANGETRYRYFGSGTYDVVLESFGSRSYEPVSNTVRITC